MIICMSRRFVSLSFRIHVVHVHVYQSFLRSWECLIGRRGHAAIIACSPCHMEEAIFREVVCRGEAQRTLRGTR